MRTLVVVAIVLGFRNGDAKVSTGPAVAWAIDGAFPTGVAWTMAWTPDHALVIEDDHGVRLVRDGKVVWTVNGMGNPMVAGRYIVGELTPKGLVVVDIATGAQSSALADKTINGLGTDGNDVFVVPTGAPELYKVTPAACAKSSCAKRLGKLDEEPQNVHFSVWRDKLVSVRTSTEVLVTDRRGVAVLKVADIDDWAEIAVAGDTIAVADSKGMALLAMPTCIGADLAFASTAAMKKDCVVASKAEPHESSIWLVALSGNALAFNSDHSTELFSERGGWTVKTDADGPIVADDKFVYTVTSGSDGTRLLALDRGTGRITWQTTLTAKRTEGNLTLELRDGMLAVLVNQTVYAIALGSRPS
jgi:hypothetical protein